MRAFPDMGGFPSPGVPMVVNPRTGLPFGFHPVTTRMVAAGDETTITTKADIYDGQFELWKNNTFVNQSVLTVDGRNISLPAPATAGDVYVLSYVANCAIFPGASTLTANSPLDNWFSAGGLGLWFTINTGTTCYQDLAKTTLAVADGDPVYCIVPHRQATAVPDFIAPSSGARPILKYDATLARWYLQFTAASTMYLSPTSGTAADWKWLHDGTEWCAAAKVQFGTTSVPNTAYGLFSTGNGSSGSTGCDVFYDDRTGSSEINRLRTLIANTIGTFTIDGGEVNNGISPNAVHTLSLGYHGTGNGYDTYVDAALVNSVAQAHTPVSTNPVGTLHIGIFGNGTSFPATMNLYGLAILRGSGATSSRSTYEAQI